MFGRDLLRAFGRRGASHNSSARSRFVSPLIVAESRCWVRQQEAINRDWQNFIAKSAESTAAARSSPYAEVGPHGKYIDVIIDDVKCLKGNGAMYVGCHWTLRHPTLE
eukprot:5259378-Pyramimonas_sp.AAC.1